LSFTLGAHATAATTGVKGVVLFANPTQSHPSVAHDSTISVLGLELVMMTVPLMGTPALTSDVLRLKRIETGDLVAALAAEAPQEIERRTSAVVRASLLFLIGEDYKSVRRFDGRDMLAGAPLGIRGTQVR
jgi:hypothetical protein